MKEQIFESEVKAEGDGTLRAVISTTSVDRMGDIVEVSGIDLENFKRNSVVLWNHDYSSLPVGRALEINVVGNKLVSRIQWAPTSDGQALKKLYEQGFLSAFSIGFRPLEWEPIRGGHGSRYTKTELLEYSAVAVPANQEALVVGRSSNLLSSKGLRKLFLGAAVGEPALESLPEYQRVKEATAVAAAAAARAQRLTKAKAPVFDRMEAIKLSIRAMHVQSDAWHTLLAAGRSWQARKQLDLLKELVA